MKRPLHANLFHTNRIKNKEIKRVHINTQRYSKYADDQNNSDYMDTPVWGGPDERRENIAHGHSLAISLRRRRKEMFVKEAVERIPNNLPASRRDFSVWKPVSSPCRLFFCLLHPMQHNLVSTRLLQMPSYTNTYNETTSSKAQLLHLLL